ncbi:hypothetical protein B0T17DRAFT_137393 [Bombardia bombarda]|uniref:Uncharacterized protein n=1 Tax=Bombardia bombarda TaxID=252184 RepID=A0AA39W9J4_9PEZI|nr:hypothetical protein B0T17DRAFT_137393 [Bombardia bombarda]
MMSSPGATTAPACPSGLNIDANRLVRSAYPSWRAKPNIGPLSEYWPYCSAAQRFTQVVMEAQEMDEYFVRVRYNDRIMTIPGCRAEGKHLDGDESLCTLSAFKSIVDKFTPRNWRYACRSNLGALLTTRNDEPAGY